MGNAKQYGKRKWFLLSCVIAIGLSCSNATFIQASSMTKQAVNKQIQLSKTTVTLLQGETETLTLLHTDKKVTFTSNNKKVASVNKKTGVITANNIGKAVITAQLSNHKKYYCKVTVKFGKAVLPTKADSLERGKELQIMDGMSLTLPKNWDYELHEQDPSKVEYICLSLPDDEYKGCIYVTAMTNTEETKSPMEDITKKQLKQRIITKQQDEYKVQNAASNVQKKKNETVGVLTFQATKDDAIEYETILIQRKGNQWIFYECIATSTVEQKQFASVANYMIDSFSITDIAQNK